MPIEMRTSYDKLFFEDRMPALEEISYAEWEKHPDLIEKMFNTDTMDQEIKQQLTMGEIPPAQQVAEGADVPYVELLQGYNKTYTALTYKLGIQCSEELYEDDRQDLVNKFHRGLARGHYQTRQIIGAGVYNDSFTSAVGPDGKELVATDHPLVNGGTGSNELEVPTAFGVAGLEAIIQLFSEMVDEQGLPVLNTPRLVIIPPKLQFTAKRIIDSPGKADEANLAINAFNMYDLTFMWNPYLSAAQGGSDTAYWVIGDTADLDIMWYDRVSFSLEVGKDFDSGGTKTKTRQRFVTGWHDWRNIGGTAGA